MWTFQLCSVFGWYNHILVSQFVVTFGFYVNYVLCSTLYIRSVYSLTQAQIQNGNTQEHMCVPLHMYFI